MLQLHMSYQQFNCLLRCDLHKRFYGSDDCDLWVMTLHYIIGPQWVNLCHSFLNSNLPLVDILCFLKSPSPIPAGAIGHDRMKRQVLYSPVLTGEASHNFHQVPFTGSKPPNKYTELCNRLWQNAVTWLNLESELILLNSNSWTNLFVLCICDTKECVILFAISQIS